MPIMWVDCLAEMDILQMENKCGSMTGYEKNQFFLCGFDVVSDQHVRQIDKLVIFR